MELDLYALGPPLGEVTALATEAERLGFAGLWFTESSHSAFLACGAAVLAMNGLTVGTNVAVAFPRSPMLTAQAAWDLAQASDGRFVLGLGSQVKAHVERRFSVPFSRPAARLREYVVALRAIWAAFNGDAPLRFEGDFYSFSLLTDFFSPGPIDHHDIPVYLAGVNRGMARIAGEVAEGFHVHPLHSVRYLSEVVRPAIVEGATAAGRSAAAVQLAVPVFLAVGETDDELRRRRDAIRRQIGFYGSTPSYRPVFELHGWGDVADELNRVQRRRDESAMLHAVTDEIVDAFSVTATWDRIAAALLDRYDGIAARVFPYGLVGWDDRGTRERWRDVASAMRGRVRARSASAPGLARLNG
jgi:probable F420-dependent oxidoreductase